MCINENGQSGSRQTGGQSTQKGQETGRGFPPDLAEMVELWPQLSACTRRGLLALARATVEGE
jgi:hypothetical protein